VVSKLALVVHRGRAVSPTHGTHDGRLPVEHVVAGRPGRARRRWVAPEVDQFLQRQMKGDGQLDGPAEDGVCEAERRRWWEMVLALPTRPAHPSLLAEPVVAGSAASYDGLRPTQKLSWPFLPPYAAPACDGRRWSRSSDPQAQARSAPRDRPPSAQPSPSLVSDETAAADAPC
jgi:hypothetical protein